MKKITKLAGVEIPKPQAHLVLIGGAAIVPLVRDRILLAGDSGGFVEPLLGEGIYFSILGGQIAAKVCAEACSSNRIDSQFLTKYADTLPGSIPERLRHRIFVSADDLPGTRQYGFVLKILPRRQTRTRMRHWIT